MDKLIYLKKQDALTTSVLESEAARQPSVLASKQVFFYLRANCVSSPLYE